MIVKPGNPYQLELFFKLPETIYHDDPNWVRPLVGSNINSFREAKRLIGHIDMELFLVLDNSEPLGRAALFIDKRHNKIHQETTAFFGFFECADDKATSLELLNAIERSALEKGMNKIVGPVDFTMNYQGGLLINGFNRPTVMTPYNREYYPRLVEEAGYRKAVDLYAYLVTKEASIPERACKIERIVRKRYPDLSVKPLTNITNFRRSGILKKVYNEAFADTWGFVPMTGPEFSNLVTGLSRLKHLDLNYVAFSGNVPVGLLLTVPDLYSVKGLNSRNRLRLTVIGVIPAFRGKGIESMMGVQALNEAKSRGYDEVEFSVIFENNTAMNNLIAREFGLEVSRTFRVYQKDLDL